MAKFDHFWGKHGEISETNNSIFLKYYSHFLDNYSTFREKYIHFETNKADHFLDKNSFFLVKKYFLAQKIAIFKNNMLGAAQLEPPLSLPS